MTADPPGIRLRDARADDLPALLALEARFPGDRLSARQFRRHLHSSSARLRMLDADAMPMGYALHFRRRGSGVARLYSVAVDPAMRGRGIGAALLADAEAIARATGAASMRLEVRADNPEAIALYRSRGYREFGRHASYYADGADALRFEKPLLPQ